MVEDAWMRPRRDNPLTRSKAGLAGMAFLLAIALACLGSLPWTLGSDGAEPPLQRRDSGRGASRPVVVGAAR
jgi:hypothetical protein